MISIYLRGDSLNPVLVSDTLGILPTRQQKKGEFTSPSERYIAKIGLWAVSIESNYNGIASSLEELLQMFKNVKMPLTNIDGVDEAHIDILFTGEEVGEVRQTAEVMLSIAQIRVIKDLGLGIQFTSY